MPTPACPSQVGPVTRGEVRGARDYTGLGEEGKALEFAVRSRSVDKVQ